MLALALVRKETELSLYLVIVWGGLLDFGNAVAARSFRACTSPRSKWRRLFGVTTSL